MLDKQSDADKAIAETEKRLKILQSWLKAGLITQSQFDNLQPIILQKSLDSNNNSSLNFVGIQPFSTFFPSKDLITLNVGGKLYTTLKETVANPLHLTIQENGSTKQVVEKHLLSQIFSEPFDKDNFLNAFESEFNERNSSDEFSDKSGGRNENPHGLAKLDNEGHVFFDRNGDIFTYILDYLRAKGDLRKCTFPYGNPSLLKQIEIEANFFYMNWLAGFLSKLKPGPINMPGGGMMPQVVPAPMPGVQHPHINAMPSVKGESQSSPIPLRESAAPGSSLFNNIPMNNSLTSNSNTSMLAPNPAASLSSSSVVLPPVIPSGLPTSSVIVQQPENYSISKMMGELRPNMVLGYHFDPNHCHPDVMTTVETNNLTLQVRPTKSNKYYRTCIISPELILDPRPKVDPRELNYLEVNCDTTFVCIGITSQTTETSLSGSLGGKQNKNSFAFEAYNSGNGNKKNGGKSDKFGDGIIVGTRVGVWADIAGGKMWVFKNGKNMGAIFSGIDFTAGNQKWYFGATLALKVDKVTIIPGARHPELKK